MNSLVRLDVQGISASQVQSGTYILVLSERGGQRKLPVVIGGFEAQSIAIAIEKEIKPPRPLTHDLFEAFAHRFDISLKKVIISKLVDGIFYSNLICERDGIEEIIDARNSDAVALALRFDAPIYTYENILRSSGILLDSEDGDSPKGLVHTAEKPKKENKKLNSFSDSSKEELQESLKKAIEDEDYEKAAVIRDEINQRKNS